MRERHVHGKQQCGGEQGARKGTPLLWTGDLSSSEIPAYGNQIEVSLMRFYATMFA